MSTRIPFARLLVAGISTLALSGCGHSEADPRVGPPLVQVAQVGATGQATRGFTGVVSARVQSDLGFRVGGKVVQRLVDAGQVVRKGQPLMRIDRTDLALATLASTGVVAAARARALQTRADEKRYRELVSAGAVSASAYDQSKAAADAASAQLSAAEAQYGVAKNEAGYSLLVADSDGTVVETLAEPGQVVTSGQVVVRIAHAGPREATISLPETIRPAIGSTAQASLFDERGAGRVGGSARLRQLSDAADPRTRTFDARYVLAGPAARAPLGSTVTIALPDVSDGAAMQVPISAVYDEGKGPGVWILGGPSARPVVNWRRVRLASVGDETATVVGGLRTGERFVSLGAHLLHQGEQVRLAPGQGDAR